MAVRIRLKRTGTRNMSCFRVVVMDQRMSRDGKAIEELGFYDPRKKQEALDMERYDHWVANGASVSETVGDIAARLKGGVVLADRQRPASVSKKAKAKMEAEAKAKAEAAAAAAPAEAN